MSRWRRRAALGVLLLAVVGVAGPVATAVSSGESCCAKMQKAGPGGESPVRCQWITPSSCCEQGAAVGTPPPLAPAASLPSPLCSAWPAEGARGILPVFDHPTPPRLLLATVVLRL